MVYFELFHYFETPETTGGSHVHWPDDLDALDIFVFAELLQRRRHRIKPRSLQHTDARGLAQQTPRPARHEWNP